MRRNRRKQRMEKTRDLFKKIESIKGTFHMRMSMIKDRNNKDRICKDLTEGEEIKKNTGKLCKERS